jgi:hypothetical protein
MLRNNRSQFFKYLASNPSAYPRFVLPNNSLANIDRTNKIFIPLHSYYTILKKKQVPKPPGSSEKVQVIPPTATTSGYKILGEQKGSGYENPQEIMKFPIKVCVREQSAFVF